MAQHTRGEMTGQIHDSHASPKSLLARLLHFIHGNFLWFLLGSYAVAALLPGFGLWIKDVSLGQVPLAQTKVSLPMAMLALLLLNAGLGVESGQLSRLRHRSRTLVAGVVANLVVPVAFIFVVAQTMRLWHNPDEVQNILVGLALVASMPIAGSSTAWSQNANGNLALSLGLVLALHGHQPADYADRVTFGGADDDR